MLSRIGAALGFGGGSNKAAAATRFAGLANIQAGTVASRPMLSLPPDAQLSTALQTMYSNGAGAVSVCDGNEGPLEGILTERDILTKHDFNDVLCTAPISGLMTPVIEVAAPSWSLERCLDLMLDNHFRHLPVLNPGAGAYGSVGAMLSMRDICRVLTSQDAPAHGASALTLGDAIEDARRLWQPEVPPECSIVDAAEAMRAAGTGSVLIPLVAPSVASSAQAFGLFTERDLLKVLAVGPRDVRSELGSTQVRALTWINIRVGPCYVDMHVCM